MDWGKAWQVREAYRLLKIWYGGSKQLYATLFNFFLLVMICRHVGEDPSEALQLLHYDFADARIRETAIRRLEIIPDDVLEDYLLQLVQVGPWQKGGIQKTTSSLSFIIGHPV